MRVDAYRGASRGREPIGHVWNAFQSAAPGRSDHEQPEDVDPEQGADLERSVLRSLPADFWVTAHARRWGRYRKFVARATAKNPVDPFIDPEGYRAYIDAAEAEFRRGVVHSPNTAPTFSPKSHTMLTKR